MSGIQILKISPVKILDKHLVKAIINRLRGGEIPAAENKGQFSEDSN